MMMVSKINRKRLEIECHTKIKVLTFKSKTTNSKNGYCNYIYMPPHVAVSYAANYTDHRNR